MAGQSAGRPLERRSAARTAVVWEGVQQLLGELPAQAEGAGRRGQRVVDIGGGTGGFAVRVAELGHHVTVVDPSPDALAALARRAEERGLADRVTAEQGDLADLPGLVEPGADLVLCHGVLGILDDPGAALGTIAQVLRPGGGLSLLVGQRHAAVLARAMAGHLGEALELLDAAPEEAPASLHGERRFTAEEVTALLDGAGFTTHGVHAIRVFADWVPAALLDLQPQSTDALVALERAVATRPEYLALAAQLHVLATR